MAVGSLARRLPESLAGSLPASPYGVVDPDVVLRAALGANLLHWWEPRESETTLNGANISQIDNLVSGGGAMVQATAGAQMLWVASRAAINGRPVAQFQDVSRRMTASIAALGAGHRTGVYLVVDHGNDGSGDKTAVTLHHSTPTTAFHFYARDAASPHGIKMFADFSAGTDFNARVNDYVAGFVLRSFRPLSTGARDEIDGALSSAQPSNTNGLIDVNRATFGHPSAGGETGEIAMLLLTTEPTTAIDDAVKDYVTARFGLSLS